MAAGAGGVRSMKIYNRRDIAALKKKISECRRDFDEGHHDRATRELYHTIVDDKPPQHIVAKILTLRSWMLVRHRS